MRNSDPTNNKINNHTKLISAVAIIAVLVFAAYSFAGHTVLAQISNQTSNSSNSTASGNSTSTAGANSTSITATPSMTRQASHGATTTASTPLDCNAIAAKLNSGIAVPNGNVCDIVLVRQSPQIVDQSGMVQNKFTLMNTVIEFTPATIPTTSNGTGQQVSVVGDFALLESEANPVLQVIVPAGWEVTGMHNHMIQETPKLSFMHWRASGSLDTIIGTIKQALSHTTIMKAPTPAPAPASGVLDCNAIASKLGSKIAIPNGNLCDIVLVRQSPQIMDQNGTALNIFTLMNSVIEVMPANATTSASANTTTGSMANSTMSANTVKPSGIIISPSTNAAINTTTTSSSQQVFVMGDFALLESEVNPVLQVIVPANWTVTGFHNHMIMETPKLSFMHWTAQGDLNTIINTANSALDKTTIPHGTTTSTSTSSTMSSTAKQATTTITNATSAMK